MGATSRERYAVVSCHVERPLDDAVWARFSRSSGDGRAASRSPRSCGPPIRPSARTRRPGSSERARQRRSARSGTTRTGRPRTTRDRRGGRDDGRARSRRGRTNARARSRADALLRRWLVHGRRASPRRAPSSATSTARPALQPTSVSAPRASGGRRSTRRPSWSCRRAASFARSRRRTRSAILRARSDAAICLELVHVYFHDTDLLDAPAGAPSRRPARCSRAGRSRPTSTSSRCTRSRLRLAWRGTTWRGSNFPACRAKVAPPAELSRRGADAARARRRPCLPPLRALARLDRVARPSCVLGRRARLPRRRRPRARHLPRARHPPDGRRRRRRPLGLPLARGAGRVAQVRCADHGARLRAGGPLPAARAAARPGADPRVPHRRRADRARVRDRDGLRLLDLRPHPDVGRRLGRDDRPPARRLRVGLARGHARRRHPAARRARRRRREPRAPARVARVGAQRSHLRVRRRRRARGRVRASSSSARAPSFRSCSTRSGPTR